MSGGVRFLMSEPALILLVILVGAALKLGSDLQPAAVVGVLTGTGWRILSFLGAGPSTPFSFTSGVCSFEEITST